MLAATEDILQAASRHTGPRKAPHRSMALTLAQPEDTFGRRVALMPLVMCSRACNRDTCIFDCRCTTSSIRRQRQSRQLARRNLIFQERDESMDLSRVLCITPGQMQY